MVIGGFQKVSLSDFPGVISSIVFTRGCNFRCPYCHNPELVDPARCVEAVPWETVTAFLGSRTGRIEGVVVTGGEPTIHADLADRLAEIKRMGLKVKLDTNGSAPAVLRRLLEDRSVDFLAMDVKGPRDVYERLAGVSLDISAIRESLRLIRESGLPHEIRTTFAPAVLSLEDLVRTEETVRGCARYVIQAFRGGKTLDPALSGAASPTKAQLEEAASRFAAAGIPVEIR